MRRHKRQRRGAIYTVIMAMAMLVAVISMGGLMASRVQIRSGGSAGDFAVARLCARAGLEAAMYKIRTDPAWRTHLGNGTWYNNISLGSGAYSVSATDPVSGDVTIASNHPVLVTATGTKGAAVYKLQVQLQANLAALTCLEVCATIGSDIALSSSTLTSDQTVSTAGKFNNGSNCVANTNVETVGGTGGGGTFSKGTSTISAARILPDATHVFDYYNTNGTAIPYTALYQSNGTQLVSNTGFETNTSGWYVYSPSSINVTLTQDGTQHKGGSYSMLVSNRNGTGDVPATDLPLSSMRNGDVYALSIPVYGTSPGGGVVSAGLVLQTTTGTYSVYTTAVAMKTGSANWVTAAGNVTLSWTGTLTKATLVLKCNDATAPLDIDQVSVLDTSLPSSGYVMDRVLLSPSSNPYGATNAQGIYILDCNNQKVTIGPCRIVGTLVLLNAANGSTIQGPITWEPAVTGYPALLCNSSLAISFDGSVGLSESTYGVNFNPSGTPYPYSSGTTNTNATDGFASCISGIIYVGGDLTISTAPTIKATVVTSGKLNVNATSMTLNYNNSSFMTPPPGFSTSLPALYPVPGTWQRVTN